jgi:hypothetical protein
MELVSIPFQFEGANGNGFIPELDMLLEVAR